MTVLVFQEDVYDSVLDETIQLRMEYEELSREYDLLAHEHEELKRHCRRLENRGEQRTNTKTQPAEQVSKTCQGGGDPGGPVPGVSKRAPATKTDQGAVL